MLVGLGGYHAETRSPPTRCARIPRLQVELDEEAQVVLSSSERLNPALIRLVPVEAYLARDPGDAETGRALLVALAASESTRSMLYERTFFLQALYGPELTAARDRRVEIRALIQEDLGD